RLRSAGLSLSNAPASTIDSVSARLAPGAVSTAAAISVARGASQSAPCAVASAANPTVATRKAAMRTSVFMALSSPYSWRGPLSRGNLRIDRLRGLQDDLGRGRRV